MSAFFAHVCTGTTEPRRVHSPAQLLGMRPGTGSKPQLTVNKRHMARRRPVGLRLVQQRVRTVPMVHVGTEESRCSIETLC